MTDPRLMVGDGWIRCCICGAAHFDPYPDLYVDEQGVKWDVCRSCADDEMRAAGVSPRSPGPI